MRRWLIPLLLVAVVGGPAAHADTWTPIATDEVTLHAPVPCAVLCPYWTEELGHDGACQPEPLAPPGSWDDHRFVVPAEFDGRVPDLLTIEVEIETDYDNFLCLVSNPGPDETWEEYSCCLTLPVDPCDNSIGPIPLGCDESMTVLVDPGMVLVLRAYNWSDAADEHAVLRWWDV